MEAIPDHWQGYLEGKVAHTAFVYPSSKLLNMYILVYVHWLFLLSQEASIRSESGVIQSQEFGWISQHLECLHYHHVMAHLSVSLHGEGSMAKTCPRRNQTY